VETESHEVVTIRSHPTYDDLLESEAGLARLIGRDIDRPSGPAAFGLRLGIGVFSRFTTTVTTISDDGVLVQGSKYGTIPWAEFGDGYETDGLVCLVVARTTAPIAIQKRAMTPAQLDLVRRYVAARVTPDEPGHVATNWGIREQGGATVNAGQHRQQRPAAPEPGPQIALNAEGQAPPNHLCGKCGKPLSPVWKGRCRHCGATYADFPPVPAA
jgi:hypothetical protein